ncbi:MAG: hypothetical protein JO034_04610, partial [Singulisphaera sp.]|nr:hypothetical protein [Singulisphaera sp.]
DPSNRAHKAAMLRALDECVVATRPEEVTLGEWFMRWDSGTWPLVIDRLALGSAGWGPKSRVLPPRADPARRGAARAAVRPLGLTVVPIGGVLLITTQAEAPDRPGGPLRDPAAREAWETTLREASAWGADRSDRFQSVARWRGEVTPKALASSEADDDSAQAPAGWRVWRFAAPGWPGPDALVRLVDERSRAAWRWAVALAVLVVGIAAGRLPAPTRAAGVAALLAVALLAVTIPVARASEVPSGAIGGALAVLCFWLGQALPRRIRGAIWESQASTTSRAANLGAPLTLLVLVGFVASALSAPPELAGRDREPPILALFPYDGPPNPSRAPDRVLLRLEDYDRLRALAEESQSQAGPGVGIGALAASHRVAWQGDRDVLVESEFELSNDARSGSAEAWVFPVEGVRDVAATLDDVAVPVLVRPGGRSASVLVTGRGRHRLRVRRTATPRRGAAGLMLSLSINPVASARVAVAGSPSGERIEVPNARGRLDARDGGLDGALGPVGRLEARWLAAPGPGAQRVADAGAVDGLILWDAEPAGDHIRARLTYHNPEGTSVLRLALDPGLVVRPVVLPGLTDVTWEGTAEHLEWVASVDPPLPCGATVSLELWRPSPPTTAPTPTSGPSPADEPASRPMPRIEPLGVERFSGAVAFRRPPDWLGQLAADAVGGEAITDEAFVKAWGNLPEGPLTHSGTARFFRAPAPAPRTGPVPDRVCVQTRVQLDVGAGRVGMDLEAD